MTSAAGTRIDCTGVPWGSVSWTMLGTLYLRAYESRSPRPILGDRAAAEAVQRIDYDFDRMRKVVRPSGNQYLVALRARQFDRWVAEFLAAHPDAVVLHLGCGLDSRPLRLDLPAGVDWYDVDVPEVIELRRRIFPETGRHRLVGASVTDQGWLAAIPADRPAVVVAEGLLPYLHAAEVRELFRRLTDHFESGEIHADVVPPWVTRFSRVQHWGATSERELVAWNPRLRLMERATVMTQYADIPARGYRAVYRVCAAVPGLRTFPSLFRFAF